MPFPNVPIAPGVPPVPRDPFAPIGIVALVVADVLSILNAFLPVQWGIFQNGVPVLDPDTVVTVDYRQSWTISDYPVEQGAFESYDKVNTPYEARVRMAVGGSVASRIGFLTQVNDIAGTTDLYEVVTPERVYLNANVVSFGYNRAAESGLGLLVVDIALKEVRVSAPAVLSNTRSPTAAAPVGGGSVTAQPPTPNQLKAPLLTG